MLLFFDAVRDDEGIDTTADGSSVAVPVINLRWVDVNDDNAADDVNGDADDCDGDDVMANDDVNAVAVVFVVDNNGDDETGINVIDDVLTGDIDSNADNAAEEVNAPANDNGVADIEIVENTFVVVVAVTLAGDSESESELWLDVALELPRRRRRRRCPRERWRRRLGFGFGLG